MGNSWAAGAHAESDQTIPEAGLSVLHVRPEIDFMAAGARQLLQPFGKARRRAFSGAM
jgi:hypothetical protein